MSDHDMTPWEENLSLRELHRRMDEFDERFREQKKLEDERHRRRMAEIEEMRQRGVRNSERIEHVFDERNALLDMIAKLVSGRATKREALDLCKEIFVNIKRRANARHEPLAQVGQGKDHGAPE